jgi:hypothetical protein
MKQVNLNVHVLNIHEASAGAVNIDITKFVGFEVFTAVVMKSINF